MDTITRKSETLQEILTTNPNEVNKEKELNDFEEDMQFFGICCSN